MNIHPSAIVSSLAQIGEQVQIGPFCVVEPGVTIGRGCRLASRVVLKTGTVLGHDNLLFDGAVLGGLPQHVHLSEHPGKVLVGSGNTIRENVTIHRALEADEATIIGDNSMLMVNAHIAHDCRLANNIIVANNVLLAGHVTVGDRAYLSGAVAIHQFCRVGTMAMVGGQAHVTKDVPPYVTIDGLSSCVVGLNQIGLRRAGYRSEDVVQLKEAYRVIYRSRLTWTEILARLQQMFSFGPAVHFYQFLATTTRGIISERRPPPGATIKLRRDVDQDTRLRVRAG